MGGIGVFLAGKGYLSTKYPFLQLAITFMYNTILRGLKARSACMYNTYIHVL